MVVDSAFLEKEYGAKIAQRIEEYTKAIALFAKKFGKDNPTLELFVADHAARNLTYLYFNWCYNLVKPSVRELADRYKIASTTQFAICYVQPFSVAGFSEEENRGINANFAFFTAFNIILNFNEETDITHYTEPNLSFDGAIAPMEDKMDKILENHRRYLAALSSVHESPAIISNAFTLELIDLFFKFRWQALMV